MERLRCQGDCTWNVHPLFEFVQNPPPQPVPVQFAVSAMHELLDPYGLSSPAGFQAMLPDRSRRIRASGAVDVVTVILRPLGPSVHSPMPACRNKRRFPT